MNNKLKRTMGIFSLSAALFSNVVYADTNEDWNYGVSVYGWFPDMSGTTSFPDDGGGDFTIPIGDILDNLSFTFQGAFDARKGQWGLFSDVIYMDLSKKNNVISEGTIGGNDLPYDVKAHVGFGMKSWIWTSAVYYRALDTQKKSFDFLGGVRYLDISQSLNWNLSGNVGEIPIPGREGSAKVGATYWDAIIGMRGRVAFGQDNSWFLPYYLDIGTGNSDVTWQAMGGIGYAFKWGELVAAWRYLDYDLPSDKAISDMDFSGPAMGAIFRW